MRRVLYMLRVLQGVALRVLYMLRAVLNAWRVDVWSGRQGCARRAGAIYVGHVLQMRDIARVSIRCM